MNIEWNATNYTNHFSFVHKYGEDVLKLIDAPAGSRVLDLGCGNGALTKKLKELGFQVQGMDASSEMLHVARKNYPDIRFEKGDATQFTLQDPVDVIFSNAVFHWIDAEKQDALAARIASALKPGGTLVCEFGGKNCAESVHAMLEQWAIETAQKRIETNNYGIRVRLLQYDQVMNEQRELIYAERRKVLEKPLWTG